MQQHFDDTIKHGSQEQIEKVDAINLEDAHIIKEGRHIEGNIQLLDNTGNLRLVPTPR